MAKPAQGCRDCTPEETPRMARRLEALRARWRPLVEVVGLHWPKIPDRAVAAAVMRLSEDWAAIEARERRIP